jgi:hypothetical protein
MALYLVCKKLIRTLAYENWWHCFGVVSMIGVMLLNSRQSTPSPTRTTQRTQSAETTASRPRGKGRLAIAPGSCSPLPGRRGMLRDELLNRPS